MGLLEFNQTYRLEFLLAIPRWAGSAASQYIRYLRARGCSGQRRAATGRAGYRWLAPLVAVCNNALKQ